MACGRPVVAVRAGAVPEFVDETVGMLAEPCNGASMAEAIAALYERDIEAIGVVARTRVLRRFTWQKAFQAQLTAYASLVGTRRLTVPKHEIIELRSPTS
jgi:alpha-1,6-mannosyltransferase